MSIFGKKPDYAVFNKVSTSQILNRLDSSGALSGNTFAQQEREQIDNKDVQPTTEEEVALLMTRISSLQGQLNQLLNTHNDPKLGTLNTDSLSTNKLHLNSDHFTFKGNGTTKTIDLSALYSLQDDFETHFIRALDQSTIEHITSATMEIKDEIFFGSDATLSYMDNGESKTITLTRLAELMSIIEAQEAGD